MKILIAEDDVQVASYLSASLEAENYDVSVADSGLEVVQQVERSHYDLIVLDLNLPDIGGIDVLRRIRISKPDLPVLILTGSALIEDRVKGLDSGADDYLTKPFAFEELSARVRALLRRKGPGFERVLHSSDLELDRVQRTVRRRDRVIDLTPKEFALLEYLMLHAGSAVSRSSIIRHVWKLSSDSLTNVVDVYINYLRRKIDLNAGERIIQTVRGSGYRVGESFKAAR